METVLLGAALSADAMSVTVVNMLADPRMPHAHALAFPLVFGLFQGLMPFAGWLAGSAAADLVTRFSGIVAFVILGVVGGNMVREGVKAMREDEPDDEVVRAEDMASASAAAEGSGQDDSPAAGSHGFWRTLVLQAVATSIDAFAVGITFVGADDVAARCAVIAACTFALCFAMLFVGRAVGERFGDKAQVVGGVVLVLIGVKALIP